MENNMLTLEAKTNVSVREKPTGPKLITPEACAKFLSPMEYMGQEAFVVMTLTTTNDVIQKHLVSLGTLNSALVHPREVLRVAILDSAASIIVAHNHPIGDPTPSAEDIKITRQLVQAGEIMGIKVLDHVVIGSSEPDLFQSFLSLRETGLVKFQPSTLLPISGNSQQACNTRWHGRRLLYSLPCFLQRSAY
jgi:DNA repair protein RadC